MTGRKNLKVSPETHRELVRRKGELAAEWEYEFSFDSVLKVALGLEEPEEIVPQDILEHHEKK